MKFSITVQTCFIFLGCLIILTVIDCKTLVYYCNFDTGLIDDCIFDKSRGIFGLTITSGIQSTYLKPTEPLSDVTSIQYLTIPNNEPCILPYDYSTRNWSMFFCEWNSPTNFTCPTASGIGNCIIGKYAHFKVDFGDSDETYSTNVKTKSNTAYCLDFFYYLTDASNGAKISVGWKSNEIATTIVEATASLENRWQQRRMTYISPSSEINQIWFRMTRNNTSFRTITYALDEIKIFEGPCETIPSVLNSLSDINQSDNITDQTSEIPTRFTTEIMDTTITTTPVKDTTTTTVLDTTITTTPVIDTTTTTVLDTTITTTPDYPDATSSTSIDTTSRTILDTTDTTVFEATSTTFIHSTSTSVITTATSTDKMKWTTDDDVQTSVTFETTEDDMNMTTSNTTFTSETSETGPPTFHTASTNETVTISPTKKSDLIINLGVPLGLGVPALLIVIGGLCYHYRKGQRISKAFSDRTNANEIQMTERNA